MIAFLLTVAAAHATTFANRPLSEALKEAQNIVRGTAGKSYSDYGIDHQRIYTYTNLDITDVLKGGLASGHRILVRSPGGTIDGVQMGVPGSTHFNDGEDVVLLLAELNTEDNSYDVNGMTTGKYNVKTADDGELQVVNSMGGAAIFDPGRDPGTLSYDSTIPLKVFRLIARGQKTPESGQPQFKGSTRPAPSGAFEGDEQSGPSKVQKAAPVAATAPKSEPPVSGAEPRSFPWVPVSLAVLVLIGMILVWIVLR